MSTGTRSRAEGKRWALGPVLKEGCHAPGLSPSFYPHLRFAGRTLTSGSLVLLTLDARPAGPAQLTVNSEKMVIGTMLVKDLVQALTQ